VVFHRAAWSLTVGVSVARGASALTYSDTLFKRRQLNSLDRLTCPRCLYYSEGFASWPVRGGSQGKACSLQAPARHPSRIGVSSRRSSAARSRNAGRPSICHLPSGRTEKLSACASCPSLPLTWYTSPSVENPSLTSCFNVSTEV